MTTLKEIIATWCLSDWEGCMCSLPKGHDGLHSCGAKTCSCQWTSKQSDEWWRKLKVEIPGLKGRKR